MSANFGATVVQTAGARALEIDEARMHTDHSDEINLLDADVHGKQAQELVERFERNKSKNSNEIVDNIINREAKHH